MREMFLDTCRDAGGQIELLFRTLRHTPRAWRRRSQVGDQVFQSGVQVLHVILLVGLVSGMILALQTGIELKRFGQESQVGYLVSVSMAREMAPFITGIVLAATVGSALAAELGTMSVSDELAALEILSIDRDDYLVMPRMLAMAVVAPMLTIICYAVGIAGGALVSTAQLNVEAVQYFDYALDALEDSIIYLYFPKDIYTGLLKSVVFGLLIATIACYNGIQARGGALGVGKGVRSAVRDAIIAIIIANYFLTYFFYHGTV